MTTRSRLNGLCSGSPSWQSLIAAGVASLAFGCSAAAQPASDSTADNGGGSGTTTDTTAGVSTTGGGQTTTSTAGVTSSGSSTTTGATTGATGTTGTTTSGITTGSATSTTGVVLTPTDPGVHHFVAGGYYVDGPNVYDSTGKKHMFHGLDRPSLEWDPAGQNLSAQNYTAMKAWKANIVRLSMNETYWNNNQSGYQSTVKTQVMQIEQAGMDVILDLHRTPGGGVTTADSQQCMADQGSVTFWTSVANAYKGDPKVLFELFNEPEVYNNWAFWLNGGNVTGSTNPMGCENGGNYTAVGMQQLYTAVRGAGSQNIVILGGINYAYDLSFATSPSYALKDASSPYGDGKGFNIMFAGHPYNKPASNKTYDAAAWKLIYGDIATQAPVIFTEFGDTVNCDGTFNQQTISYADANNIHWTAWAWWNMGGCTFPTLVSDLNNGTPTMAGTPVKAALLAYP